MKSVRHCNIMNYLEINQKKRCNTAKAYGMKENVVLTSVFVCEQLQFDFFSLFLFLNCISNSR